MKTLESIIQNFGQSNEGLTHRRTFLSTKSSINRDSWYSRRRHTN